MAVWKNLGLISLCLFLFQNCGDGFASQESVDIYTYATRPDFYQDVQLVSVVADNSQRQNYVFDVAISFATDPNQGVSYQLAFSTAQFVGVCATVEGTARGLEKHVRVECLMPTPDELFLRLVLVGPESEQLVETFRF